MPDGLRDYGRQGRLGLGVPQANPTVEAEMRRLTPVDVEYYTLRLTCGSDEATTRIIKYLKDLHVYISDQYAGMALDGFLFGCTGSTYMLSEAEQDEAITKAEDALGAPVVTASRALLSWFSDRSVKRIAVATPYPEWLQARADAYWSRHGFDLVATARGMITSEDTHAIYDLQSADARPFLEKVAETDADAIMLAGTGMPSLKLLAAGREMGLNIVSSNYAMIEKGLSLVGASPRPVSEWGVAS